MNGILLLNKPEAITSFKAIDKIKKKFGLKKIGHAGTLDPFATGLLVVAIGKATRIIRFFLEEDKSYEGIIELGKETDTYDIDGQIIREQEVKNINEEQVKEVFARFVGNIEQRPPAYSAIKVNGKKAYELARSGKEVKLKTRVVKIHEFNLLKIKRGVELGFSAKVSKGTYIRSLAVDVGKELNTVSTLKSLNRVASGSFRIDKSTNLTTVLCWDKKTFESKLISINDALDLPEVVIGEEELLKKIKNGGTLKKKELQMLGGLDILIKKKFCKVVYKGICIAIHRLEGDRTKVEVVLEGN